MAHTLKVHTGKGKGKKTGQTTPKKAGKHTFLGTGKQFGKETSTQAKKKKYTGGKK